MKRKRSYVWVGCLLSLVGKSAWAQYYITTQENPPASLSQLEAGSVNSGPPPLSPVTLSPQATVSPPPASLPPTANSASPEATSPTPSLSPKANSAPQTPISPEPPSSVSPPQMAPTPLPPNQVNMSSPEASPNPVPPSAPKTPSSEEKSTSLQTPVPPPHAASPPSDSVRKTTASAPAHPQNTSWMSGVVGWTHDFNAYGGISLARETGFYHYTKTDGDDFQLGAQGFALGGMLGIETLPRPWFVGGEFTIDVSTASQQDDTALVEWSQQNKRVYAWGVDLLPSWQVTPVQRLYARFGMDRASFDHTATDPSGADWIGPSFTGNAWGFVYGFGMRTQIESTWALSMEYQHTIFQGMTVSSATQDDAFSGSWTFTPEDDQWIVGIQYYLHPWSFQKSPKQRIASQGVYVGGGFGQDSDHINYSFLDDTNTLQDTLMGDAHGPFISVLGGYGYTFKRTVYLGGEGFFNYSFSRDNTTGINRFSQLDSFGAALIPGYWLNNTLLYGRLGVVYAHLTRDMETLNESPMGNMGPTFDVRRIGAELGLGYEIPLTAQLTFRSEYNAVYLSQFSVVDADNNTDQWSPLENSYGFLLVYRF